MRSRRMLCALAFLALTAGNALAATRTIPAAPAGGSAEPQLALQDQNGGGLRFRAEVGNLQVTEVSTRAGTFARLVIPGYHASHIVGAPELPMMNRLIAVPAGARARVEVTPGPSRLIDLADYGITAPLMPAQPSMPKSADPATWPFVYDRAAYAVSKVAGELVAVAPQGRLRAVDLARVEVSPVEYLPATNQIRVYETIDFRVVFDGADQAAWSDRLARTASPFFTPIYDRLANAEGIHDSYPDHVRDVVTMVIITPSQFQAQLQSFVDWKTQRGFHVVVGVIGSTGVGSTTASIQAYIAGLYDNATPELPAPSFVLFVGDVAQCPTWTVDGDATDRPYCTMDADYIPDIYYGRFSATSTAQLQAILDKTLMYDQYTMPDPSYLGEVTLIGGVDGSYGQVWANGQINYGTENYFNSAHGITSHTYLYPSSGSAEASIIADLNRGVGYINYTAHGSETSWADPTLTQSDVNGLTNAGKYGLAVANACLTATYDVSECLAETWLRAANKGGVGYIGGSNSTYWDEDYFWGVGYRASIVEHPAFDAAHQGGYDGLFHDHAEPVDRWYVTNDALVFCGDLAVQESGSSLTNYYWNIYNLMGDPSLATYLGVPAANPVATAPTVFTTQSTVTIDAAPGSYVGLTQNGALVGAGTVGSGGSVEIALSVTPLTAGVPLHLVVTMQNRQPYVANLNVIVPALVTVTPDPIDANVTTPLTVTVREADGVTPIVGVNVWAEGLGYATTPVATGPDGVASFSVTYPYGPALDIVGQRPADPYTLFHHPIGVNASPLTGPDLAVTTTFGLSDQFAMNLPGTLVATVAEPGATLWATLPDGSRQSTGAATLAVTPAQLGNVRGTIAVSGYNLYSEDFPVVVAHGTLSGHVMAGSAAVVGAVVRGYDAGDNLVFSATSNATGLYTVADEQVVGSYTIRCDVFGYLHLETPYFLGYGANTFDLALTAAPSGVFSGTVTEAGTGLPLPGTVKVYRSDTLELYTQATCNPVDGSFATVPLPYFDYAVRVSASHHIPVDITLTVDEPVVEKHYVLDSTAGDLLVIDDDGVAGKAPDKLDEKGRELTASGYESVPAKTAAQIAADLEALGYNVTVEPIATTSSATWSNYDLLVVSSGNNTTSLATTGFTTALVNYVSGGGHLLLEGGEVGYDHYGEEPFASQVMHTNDWNHDSSGNVTVAAPTHYVMSHPNVITGPIAMTYAAYGDEDAMTPTNGGVMVGSWSTYPTDASVICYDANPAPQGGQIVFFCFNYDAMATAVRPLLLENAVAWLLATEVGSCSVAGHAILAGQADHSGITVTASPGGGTTTTTADGSFALSGLYAGTYTLTASKTSWASVAQPITLADNEQRTGLNLTLARTVVLNSCISPNLSIPDNNTTGVTSTQTVAQAGVIGGLEVYVNITHTYIGDLAVTLTSPAGTSVTLHNHTGSSADNIVGWYPSPLTPAQTLAAFLGQPMQGTWSLKVVDNASTDVGTLNQWCLKISYPDPLTAVGDGVAPRVVSLGAASPNPFNPRTRIEFALPRELRVDLAIYDLGGRRVATLVGGVLPAGAHDAVWSGRDEAGRAVASGTYFYRLVADGRTLTGKLALLK